MADIRPRMLLEHKLSLNQLQIQSLEMLALTNTEIQDVLEQEYQENPMLDHQGNNCAGYEAPLHYAREMTAESEQLREDIIMQLKRQDFSEREWAVIEYLIQSMDDRGYCKENPEEVAKVLKVDRGIAVKCLEALRGLEPVGIFSASLEQCLISQLRAAGIYDPILEEIIEKYLSAVSEGKISTITRALHISTAQVGKYLHIIQKLNPIPVTGYKRAETEYIHPDIVCRKKDSGWEVKLTDDWTENYYLNDYYLKLYAECTDEELKQYFRQKLERARFIINSIESRRNTILRILKEIVRRQTGYFEQREGLVPMRMEDIADALDIHVSTVSRAVKNKYVEYPGGTVPVKELFGAAVGAAENKEGITAKQIKREIQNIIADEDRKNPVSDQNICEMLERKGMAVSRRGIAKYRRQMDILSSKRRKEIYSIQILED